MDHLVVLAAAVAAGAINAIAGGGTLVSFPALVWIGVPAITANATSTVALWPGSMSSAWAYRRELRKSDVHLYSLIVPSVIGGLAGAALLRLTPTEIFDRLVPILILFATCVFMLQERIQRWFSRSSQSPHEGARWMVGAMGYQLLVGLYGGYFGAGIGILMLAALAIMGHTDIHQMNGLKNVLAACINGIAALYFIWAGLVSWPHAAIMAAGAVAGGVAGVGLARRIGRTAVRRMVVGIGFAMAVSLMLRL